MTGISNNAFLCMFDNLSKGSDGSAITGCSSCRGLFASVGSYDSACSATSSASSSIPPVPSLKGSLGSGPSPFSSITGNGASINPIGPEALCFDQGDIVNACTTSGLHGFEHRRMDLVWN